MSAQQTLSAIITEKKSMNTPTSSNVYIKAINEYSVEQILDYYRHIFEQEPFKTKLNNAQRILLKPNMLGAHHQIKRLQLILQFLRQ